MSLSPRATAAPCAHREHGLTLIEMVVALVVFGILMAGVAELVVNSTRNAGATRSLAAIEDTGRTALQLLTSDIRRAGFFGGNVDNTNPVDMIGGLLGDTANATTCAIAGTSWATMVEQPIFGLNDTNVGYDCITNAEYWLYETPDGDELTGGDILTVRYTPSPPVPAGTMIATRPYLRTTLTEGRIFLGANEAANLIGDLTAQDYELAAHTYYVGPTGRSCQGQAIPALFRKTISDTGVPESQELLAGVEHLQFRYLVGNRYFDADDISIPTIPPAAPVTPNWLEVEAVEITVLVRSECPEPGFTNNRTFAMGDLATPYGPGDEFRRQVFTTTTQLRN